MEVKTINSIEALLAVLRKQIPEIRTHFRVKGIWIFGSYVKGRQKPGSDVDLLVEFEPGQKTYKNFIRLKFFLEETLGRQVDLVTRESIREEIKEKVYSEAVNV